MGPESSPRPFVGALAVAVLMAGLGGPAFAQELDAEGYLDRIASSEGETYHARQLVVYMGDPQSAALLDVRSGPDGRFVRAEAGTEVLRLWRSGGLGLVEGEASSLEDTAPPRVDVDGRQVLEKYEVEIDDPVDMLGVQVVPISLERRIDRVLTETMWVHADSGVVYRRELYAASGDLVGLTTILDMSWGELATMEAPDRAPAATQEVEATSDTDAPEQLAYSYELVRASELSADGTTSDHWLYSDGLHALSVFRTPGGFRAPDGFEEAEDGAWIGPGPGTWAWEGGGSSWVVVAEEPALDPEELIEPFPRGGPSIWARFGSVWSRLFGWIADLF